MNNKGSTLLVVPLVWTMTILIFLLLILMSVRVMEPFLIYQKISESALKYIFVMEEFGCLNKADKEELKGELISKGLDVDKIIINSNEEVKEYGEVIELNISYQHPYKKMKFNSSFLPEYETEHILINVHKEGVSKR